MSDHKEWSALFADLPTRSYGRLWIGTRTLPVGLTLIVTHNLWVADPRVIVTLLGWSWTTKSTLYLLVPSMPARKFRHLVERPRHFVFAGVALCVFGVGALVRVLPIGS